LNEIASEISDVAKHAIAVIVPSSSDTTRDRASEVQRFAATQVPIIRKLISNIATVNRKGKLKPLPPPDPAIPIQHFLLRIKSCFRADSALSFIKASENFQRWTLLDSFEIAFMPYSQNSLHHSVLMAARHARSAYKALDTHVAELRDGQLNDAVENFGVIPQLGNFLPPSRQKATLLQSFVRSSYPNVLHQPVAPGKLTFAQYIERKGGNPKAYEEMPADHVLCETSLIAQVCRLNIAVIWHVQGRWRTFLLPHGTEHNIVLVLLYTNMGVEQACKDGKTILQPCSSPCNRFFPLYPLNETWMTNPVFKQVIPESQDPALSASIIAEVGEFNKKVNKESVFGAVVDVEDGEDSADTASEATADATYSQWMADGFIDDDFVEQSPPHFNMDRSIVAISTTNDLHMEKLLEIYRRKVHPRVDDSDLDSLLGLGAAARATGGA